MFEKKLFCEWNPENMYYSFVDQVIKCPICKAILEDGHILRAFAGLFPGKISGTYLEKVAVGGGPGTWNIYIYTCLCIKIVYVLSILHLISIEY